MNMSFWDGLKDFGTDVVKNLSEKSQRMNEYKMRYSDLSKEELLREYHRTHDPERKIAIQSICKDRGYME